MGVSCGAMEGVSWNHGEDDEERRESLTKYRKFIT